MPESVTCTRSTAVLVSGRLAVYVMRTSTAKVNFFLSLFSSDSRVATVGVGSIQVFKPGKPISFSCTFNAKPKPETDDGPVEDATPADTA